MTKPRFELIPFGDIKLSTAARYLVKDLIPREGLVVVWGPPKCGKSFWTFDLAMHVALGWEYRGRRVTKGRSVYVACEGALGLNARSAAFRRECMAEDADEPDFYLLPTRLDLVADATALIGDIRSQIGEKGCDLLVIDTLNRSLVGSESSDEDMGNYVQAADAIRAAFNCAIVIIHHCGIDSTRPRGHTSLTGAADAQLAVKRHAAGQIMVTVEWMKDGREGDEIVSKLRAVDLGADDQGDAITSCVVEPAEAAMGISTPRKLPPAARLALDSLVKAIDAAGEIPPASNNIPPHTRAVSEDLWRRYCYDASIADTPDAKKKAFGRAAKTLQAERRIGVWGGYVWPA